MKNDIGCGAGSVLPPAAAGCCAISRYDPGTIATVSAISINRILFISAPSLELRLANSDSTYFRAASFFEIGLREHIVQYLRVVDAAGRRSRR